MSPTAPRRRIIRSSARSSSPPWPSWRATPGGRSTRRPGPRPSRSWPARCSTAHPKRRSATRHNTPPRRNTAPMSGAYKVLYALGFTPWEQMGRSPAITAQVAALFEREEAERRPPYGRALDLGCGSGIWAVKLAARGWQVTGVDFVPKAVRRARERAREAGVDVQLIEGDVTALGSSGIEPGFRLLLDFGCFHDELNDAQRLQEGREATACATPDATLLLLAWAP